MTGWFNRTWHSRPFRDVWGMARYRQRQPPVQSAPITERDHYPTEKAPALPGGTGEFGGPCRI
ncbi:MAG: hypothetical protein ACYCS8_04500 [Acidithiobacillus sp.]